MKSILLRGTPGAGLKVELTELANPSAGPGELVVDMKACGLCGTDIEKLRGQYTAALPVLGHEAVGVVSEVGEGVEGISKGERIFPHHHVSCGECYYCRHGAETMCPGYRASNLDPGGFSEAFRVPQRNVRRGGVLKLPQGVDFGEAALTEPVACCIRALDRCAVEEGSTVLVVGSGPVGMTHALLLLSRGARVFVSDINQSRLEFAERAGVSRGLNAADLEIPTEVKKLTDGRGADLVIVASGSQQATTQAMRSVRKGGSVCLFGVPVKGTKLEYDVSDVYNSEVSVFSSYGATEAETRRALDLIASRKVDLRRLVTHHFTLEDFDEAVGLAESGSAMKVIITP